jgi:tetratricopeptide (TPR) repeat protein
MTAAVCITLSMLCLSAAPAADFPAEFENALKLYDAGKFTEACAQFTALAARAPTAGSQSDALRYATLSAISARRFDTAETLLAQIPRESTRKLCQMNLLLARGRVQELVKRFEHEDLAEWPDFHIYDALLARAAAYRRLRQPALAVKDFTQAEEFATTPSKRSQLLSLAGAALVESGDDERALAVYRRAAAIVPLKGYGITKDAVISAARILAKQGKYEEALREMDQVRPAESGYWHSRPLVVRAEILAAQGRKAEAIAKYREALPGAPDAVRKSIQAALEKLR